MTVFLDGIAAQFYRGIGADIQYIAPFSKMNFFIGANNAGKSIVLNLVSERLTETITSQSFRRLEGPEIYRGLDSGEFFTAFARRPEDIVDLFLDYISKRNQMKAMTSNPIVVKELLKIFINMGHKGSIWIAQDEKGNRTLHPDIDVNEAESWSQVWPQIWHAIQSNHIGVSFKQHWLPDILKFLGDLSPPQLPKIHLIPAKRELGASGEAFDDLSGKGLLEHLRDLESPDYDKLEDNQKFERIISFLQTVTGKPEARLRVPSNLAHLLVEMDGKTLPLQALGTGIHEVVLIAAFCTIHDGSIMCIEEPEIHLHPLLQRKLIRYLLDNTESQYFIATHSAAFIDTPGAHVFHVENDGVQTRVRPALTKDSQRRALDDLGYQASDMLQTNAVIWVEGPSDRIYLNHWIKAADPRLTEGIHYTIMFYGGALIAHLTASDDAITDFIKLRDLNRNMIVIFDSDRSSENDKLKPHVQRILNEMNDGAGIAWVTAGCEIENYVDGPLLQEALRKCHPQIYHSPQKTGPFDHAFYFWRSNKDGNRSTYKNGDKVGAANIVCEQPANIDILDLRDRLEEITDMIHKANGLEAG